MAQIVVSVDVDFALVALFKVVHQMKEARANKRTAKRARLSRVRWYETREPVVCDNNRWDNLQLAQ